MDAMKNTLAVLAGVVGLLTTVLTCYAKYLDVKKSATAAREAANPTLKPESSPGFHEADASKDPFTWYAPPAARDVPQAPDPLSIERVRGLVRGPAITMIVFGTLSLFFNLFLAAFGFVDEFIMPITTASEIKQSRIAAIQRGELKLPPEMTGSFDDRSDKINAGMATVLLLSLSIPSAVAIWAGISMLRLRGYWVSVVGSFALMAGASFACCMTGFPVGVWSLWVLYKPEVASSFR
jgi:hypothetical protein